MSNLHIQKETNVEIIHKHQTASINTRLTSKAIGVAFAAMLLADLLLTSSYVMTSLPNCSSLDFFYNFTSCELQNIDKVIGVYLSLKFLFAAAISPLVICTFYPGDKISLFWYVSALTLFLTALDQMLQSQVFSSYHHMAAPSDRNLGYFNWSTSTNGFLYVIFYFVALTTIPRHSKSAFYWMLLSALVICLSVPTQTACDQFSNMFEHGRLLGIISQLNPEICRSSWNGGLKLISVSLITIGLLVALHTMQKKTVTYYWYD